MINGNVSGRVFITRAALHSEGGRSNIGWLAAARRALSKGARGTVAAAEALPDNEGAVTPAAIGWPPTIPEERTFVGTDLPRCLPNLTRPTKVA
jgi:hypothetical protein